MVCCLISLPHLGQDVFLELFVRADLFRIARHADMALINQERVAIRTEMILLPDIGRFRLPDLCRENFRLLVLHHAPAPSGDALPLAARRPFHFHLIEVAMMDGIRWQLQLPVARVPYLLAAVALLLLPAVEIADEENIQRMRRPLAEHPLRRRVRCSQEADSLLS